MTSADHDDSPHATEHAFDPANLAWTSLTAVLEEHFDASIWYREPDGRPVLLTVADIASGDMITLAVIDSLEDRDPHVVLIIDTGHEFRVAGPCLNLAAARADAPALAMSDAAVAATRAVRLCHPVRPIPADAWLDLPDDLADIPAVTDAADDERPVAVLLIDTAARRVATTGPFAATTVAREVAAHATSDTMRARPVRIWPASPAN